MGVISEFFSDIFWDIRFKYDNWQSGRYDNSAGTRSDNRKIWEERMLQELKTEFQPKLEEAGREQIYTSLKEFRSFVKNYEGEYPGLEQKLEKYIYGANMRLNEKLKEILCSKLSIYDPQCADILKIETDDERTRRMEVYIEDVLRSIMEEYDKIIQDSIRSTYADIRTHLEYLEQREDAEVRSTELRLQQALEQQQEIDEVIKDIQYRCVPLEEALTCVNSLLKEIQEG